MSQQVFISYSSANKSEADCICAAIEETGTTCWIAPRDVTPATEYAGQIVEAIEECRLLILVLSEQSNNSPQVMREIERAVSKNIPILPLRIENVILTKSMEYFISSHHWLDAYAEPLEEYFPQLINAVNKLVVRDTTLRAVTADSSHGQSLEKVIRLDIQCEGEKIRVGSSEDMNGDQSTLVLFEETTISFQKTEEYSKKIKEILSLANRSGRIDTEGLKQLKKKGQALYDDFFPIKAKECLNNTKISTLVLSIDDSLVNIPWELLFDGKEFLCLRFNMGRIVRTRHKFSASKRNVSLPLKMLVLADPQGNLESSYEEGTRLRDIFDEDGQRIQACLKSSSVSTDYMKENLRNFDMIHYAGHADYTLDDPSQSGFLLEDGKLTASDIKNLKGRKEFPAFVFSNACYSGETEDWKIKEGYRNIYGLANAFLLCGVRHYLGTFWEIQDEPSHRFSLSFYKELLQGTMIGEAVRKARREIIERFGEDSVIWTSYMLYGDPTFKYAVEQPAAVKNISGKEAHRAPITPGQVRGAKVTAVSGAKKTNWPLVAAVVFVLGALMVVFNFQVATDQKSAIQTQPTVIGSPAQSDGQRNERIDKLVSDLVARFKHGEISTSVLNDPFDHPREASIAFLDIKASGISEAEKQFVLSRITQGLHNSKRIKIVDREIIDSLLRELKLSSSELSNPVTALRIGRILSARVMITGTILKDKKDWMVNLRLIETETTSVISAISSLVSTKDINEVASDVSSKILGTLLETFPIQGKISAIDTSGSIVVNFGSSIGASSGSTFDVIDQSDQKIAEIKIIEANKLESRATVQSGTPQIGQRVRENI